MVLAPHRGHASSSSRAQLLRLRDPLPRQPPGAGVRDGAARAGASRTRSRAGSRMFDRTEIKDIVAYLRLIANDDDDPAFLRAVTAPKRGIGQTTLARLGDIAGAAPARACSPRRSRRSSRRPCRRASARRSREFCALINDLRYRARARARGAAARRAHARHRLRGLAHRHARQARRDRARARACATSSTGSARKGETDDRNLHRAHADDRAHHDAREPRRRGRGRGAPVDAARGEGPRVSARVHRRAGGGHPAAPRVDRRRATSTRSAGSCTSASRARGSRCTCRGAAARKRAGERVAVPAVALHRRARAGGPALRRRAAARRTRPRSEKVRGQRAPEVAEGDAAR